MTSESRLSAALKWIVTPAFQEGIKKKISSDRAKSSLYRRIMFRHPRYKFRNFWQARLICYMHRPLLVDKPTRFGCSQWELRNHIESQFKPWMNWENYASLWEVDHIYPASKFDLPKELFQCFHYTNLRPRCCALNKIDGGKLKKRPPEWHLLLNHNSHDF